MHRLRHVFLPGALCLGLLALGGCQRDHDDGRPAPQAAGSVQAAVGPVPGPKPPPSDRPGPYAGNAVAMVEGRRLFVRFNCSGCHGGRGGGGMGPSLRDQDWIYGSSDSEIFDSIAQGRAHGMPAWGTRLPADQIWKLVAYIDSMRTPDEPDAPRK
jgi:cytochrome c oxidase cbb3-type subunit III